MVKSLAAILVAPLIAAAITLLSATTDVIADPLPKPAADAMRACNQQPWPYSNCVGTEFGNPKVRLIAINRAN